MSVEWLQLLAEVQETNCRDAISISCVSHPLLSSILDISLVEF